MKKLIKKILTNKKARNTEAMDSFVRTAANVGQPWSK